MTTGASFHDPRMRGFRSRMSVEAVLDLIDRRVGRLGSETVDLRSATGRVLTLGVVADRPVPAFDRAAMDGYAVRGEETFGADRYGPIPFEVVGRVRPGGDLGLIVGPGQAAEIATGAPMPGGADTVVRVESTERVGRIVRVAEPTPPGRHVGRIGEDIPAGTVVLPERRRLRPQDLGVLSSIGLGAVEVVRRPKVSILVTGDEVLPSGSVPTGTRIVDANSPMLAALVDRDGGRATIVGPISDDRDLIRSSLLQAVSGSDLVMISGGTSTGPEDHAPGIVDELGELAVHGVAIRPASPTGLGFLGEVPVLLLPGNPVSCLCAYDFFGGPIVRRLGGRAWAWPYRSAECRLGGKLASVVGRVDYARVSVQDGKVEPIAISGASILSSTTRADGFVVVPADLEGYAGEALVTVWLYD